jgi:hypothetical protein
MLSWSYDRHIQEVMQQSLLQHSCKPSVRFVSTHLPLAYEIAECLRLHGSFKRSGAKLLRDWARANHFVGEVLRQALALPDEIEPAAEGICGDFQSRKIWRLSIPNFFKPLEDHVSTGGQSQLMSLCILPGIRCPA